MDEIAVIEPDAGERLAFLGASSMRLKLDGGAGGGLGFYEYVSEPGVAGSLQHIHHGHDETFYVVRGIYEFTSGREVIVMPTGGFLSVPRGTPHAFRNAGDDTGCIVGTFNSSRFADYFRELAGIIDETGGPPDHATWTDLYSRYDTTFHEADPS